MRLWSSFRTQSALRLNLSRLKLEQTLNLDWKLIFYDFLMTTFVFLFFCFNSSWWPLSVCLLQQQGFEMTHGWFGAYFFPTKEEEESSSSKLLKPPTSKCHPFQQLELLEHQCELWEKERVWGHLQHEQKNGQWLALMWLGTQQSLPPVWDDLCYVNSKWAMWRKILLQRQNNLVRAAKSGWHCQVGWSCNWRIDQETGFRASCIFGLATEELLANRYWVCCTFGFLILSSSSHGFIFIPKAVKLLEWTLN